jgi:putative IMPACT (imprinted ancient) family translation regulator
VPQLEAHNVDKISEEFTSGGNGGVKMALRVDTDKLERLASDLKDTSSGQIELQEQT